MIRFITADVNAWPTSRGRLRVALHGLGRSATQRENGSARHVVGVQEACRRRRRDEGVPSPGLWSSARGNRILKPFILPCGTPENENLGRPSSPRPERLEGPAPSGPWSRRSATLHKNRIFIEVAHDLFKVTTVDENTGGPRSVGATIATGDGGHPLADDIAARSAPPTLKTAISRERLTRSAMLRLDPGVRPSSRARFRQLVPRKGERGSTQESIRQKPGAGDPLSYRHL